MNHPLIAQHHPTCYPSTPDAALAFFRDVLALPRSLPPPPARSRMAGIVAPHLDFRFGLSTYAAAFGALLDAPLSETYIVLGVGHRSRLEWNLDRRDYVTPLGRAECAQELVDALAVGAPADRVFSPKAHEGEWSIEFPLVWLQALHQLRAGTGKKAAPVRFVPILCGGMHAYIESMVEWDAMSDFHRLSRALREVLEKELGSGRVQVIVSIDGCHMGPRFDHPFRVTPQLLRATAAWEEQLWAVAAAGNVRKFMDWFRAEGNDRYFDGVGTLALLMNSGAFAIQRTQGEQWFTERDASVVTISSGRVLENKCVEGSERLDLPSPDP